MQEPRSKNSRSQMLTVVKVGGSVLVDPGDLRRVTSAIIGKRREGGSLLVVASALKGVTDLLDLAAMQALDRRLCNGYLLATLETFRRRHLEVARDLGDSASIQARARAALAEVETLIESIRTAGELPDATYARLLSYGERLSAMFVAAAIQAAGHEAQPVAAEEAGLRAVGNPRAGTCDISASAPGFRQLRRRLDECILVLTGFYGVDCSGGVVLFGRGGSDDTACAAAAGLGADRLELWKDVPGLMSADPQQIHGARVVQEVSFEEAAQLGAYGSGVVNQSCLEPLRGRSIQVLISAIPGAGSITGTRLVENPRRGSAQVVALAARRSPALIGAVGDGVANDPEIRSRMLSCLVAARVRSDFVARPSGQSGLGFTVHPDDLAGALSSLHESFFAVHVGGAPAPAARWTPHAAQS